MKNYEVLVLISMMVTNGRGIKANVGGRDFRLERPKNKSYDIWHDETTNRVTMIVDEQSHTLLDKEWGNEECEDVRYPYTTFNFSFTK